MGIGKEEFLDELKSRVLVMDGAMGTMLQEKGLRAGVCPELLNLTHPLWVSEVHRAYGELGVDILVTNTFGGNRLKLAEYGLEDKITQINSQGVRLAKEAAGERVLVAASIGPTGQFIEPFGKLTWEEAHDVFREQIVCFAEAGADLLLLETFSDIKEMKAALSAAREASLLPILATVTFQENLRTLLGTGPEEACVILEALGADLVGANCSLGMEGTYEVFLRMRQVARRGLVFRPNAGIPHFRNGRPVYPTSPEKMAQYALRMAQDGANVIGGCCGTTPAHLAAVIRDIKGMTPTLRKVETATRLATRTRMVTLGRGQIPVVVGERINPTGKKDLAQELREGRFAWIKNAAREQVEKGAVLLDVNVASSMVNEPEAMKRIVFELQKTVDVPLVLDSGNPAALEAGLRAADGKMVLNSVSGKVESLATILPLARKYGAAVIGLTLDEKGVPRTAEERLSIAIRILDAALFLGIPREDILIDCLVLTAGAQQDQVQETLQALKRVKEELGVTTILGISNVSHGLPHRSLLNASFVAMALAAGLDAAIVDPLDARVREAFSSGCVLAGRDRGARAYLERVAGVQLGDGILSGDPNANIPLGPLGQPAREKDPLKEIFAAVLSGNREEMVSWVEKALKSGVQPLEISNRALIAALDEVGQGFEKGTLFLPQLMMAAEAVEVALEHLKRETGAAGLMSQGRVLLATVQGDIHDIGKNIVSALMQNHGFEVIDLGKNVASEEIYRQASAREVHLVGLSALMTTTMQEMGRVTELFRRRDCSIPIMIGGAAVNQEFADHIGAHYYAKNALEAVAQTKVVRASRVVA